MKKTSTTKQELTYISTASTLFILIQTVFAECLYPLLESSVGMKWLSVVLALLVDAGLFTLLVLLCRGVYVLIVFHWKHPELDLEGQWYHVHVPYCVGDQEIEQKRTYLRAGLTTIKQSIYDLSFFAINHMVERENGKLKWTDDNAHTTTWEYRSVELCETVVRGKKEYRIYACFDASSGETDYDDEGNKLSAAKRLGVHNLAIVKKGLIEGYYCDAVPSKKWGKIVFFRQLEDCESYINDYFDRHYGKMQ